jgi:hypothetical protein
MRTVDILSTLRLTAVCMAGRSDGSARNTLRSSTSRSSGMACVSE